MRTRLGRSGPVVGRRVGRLAVQRLFGAISGEDQPELTDKLASDPDAEASAPEGGNVVERD